MSASAFRRIAASEMPGLPLVRTQVLEQPAHKPAVIRLANNVFFVGGGLVFRLVARLFLRTLLGTSGPGFRHAVLYSTGLSQ